MTNPVMRNNLDSISLEAKVRRLAELHEDDEIADICRIVVGQVRHILRGTAPGRWWVRCNRTGQTFPARSERGGYIAAQMKGLTDWCYVAGPQA